MGFGWGMGYISGSMHPLPVIDEEPQKSTPRKREGLHPGRGDRIASPSSCFPGGTSVPENTASNLLARRFSSLSPSDKKTHLVSEMGFIWSGRQDSNLRPSAPKADALARLRHAPFPKEDDKPSQNDCLSMLFQKILN